MPPRVRSASVRLCGWASACAALIAGCAGPSHAAGAGETVVDFLSAPPGFRVTYVSKHVPGARGLAFTPNGDLIVTETQLGEVAVIHPGSSPDDRPDVFDVGLALPDGAAFANGKLFIATWHGVLRYDYPARKPTALFSNMPVGSDHNRRALAIGGDGGVFVSSGSTCNVCEEADARFATILRYGPGDDRGKIYARGLRNASGIAFDAHGRLWAVVNQRDNIAPTAAVNDNLPPDEFDLISSGGDYGWPQCYPDPSLTRRLPNPEYPKANCANRVPATLNIEAHSAPLGLVFYNAGSFPSAHRGNAFVALHGSWNRTTPSGDKVIEVTFTDGKPTGYSDFVTGWLEKGQYRGRPAGLAVGPDGALYISDDKLGSIFRVSYAG